MDSKLNLLGMIELPISLKQICYQELDVETVKYTEKQAITATINELQTELLRQLQDVGEIVKQDVKTQKGDNTITVVVTIECIEKVGVKKKLEGY